MTPFRVLDPVQRRAIDLCCSDGNCLVLGEAGTGKSVVLAHAVSQYKIKFPKAKVGVLSYTNALVALLEHDLAGRDVPTMTIHECMNTCRRKGHYDCLFVDEVQDIDPSWARVLKPHCEKFVLVGDFGQQIYKDLHPVFEDKDALCNFFGIGKERIALLGTDYRLPKNCRGLVQSVFMDRKLDSRISRLLANSEVTLFHGADWEDEIKYVIEKAKSTARPSAPSAVLFEVKQGRPGGVFRFLHAVDPSFDGSTIKPDEVNDKLREHGIPFRFLGNGFGDLKESDERAITYVMTWHSAKGLDFETVIVPSFGSSKCRPNPFYVALTRARRNLVLTYSSDNPQVEKILTCDFVRRLKRNAEGRIEAESVKQIQPDLFGGIF